MEGSHDHALWEISGNSELHPGKTVTNFDVLDGTKYEGDDDENNAWTRYLKEKLNVQNTNLFEANDGDDYEQKVSMAIVSGEIPDIMGVGDYDTLKQL